MTWKLFGIRFLKIFFTNKSYLIVTTKTYVFFSSWNKSAISSFYRWIILFSLHFYFLSESKMPHVHNPIIFLFSIFRIHWKGKHGFWIGKMNCNRKYIYATKMLLSITRDFNNQVQSILRMVAYTERYFYGFFPYAFVNITTIANFCTFMLTLQSNGNKKTLLFEYLVQHLFFLFQLLFFNSFEMGIFHRFSHFILLNNFIYTRN